MCDGACTAGAEVAGGNLSVSSSSKSPFRREPKAKDTRQADTAKELAAPVSADAAKTAAGAGMTATADPGLKERRRMVRAIPVPEAHESESDSDWAAFQELASGPSPLVPDPPASQ